MRSLTSNEPVVAEALTDETGRPLRTGRQRVFLHTLCAVDIATGWVELQPVWGKGHKRVRAALHEIRRRLMALYETLNPLQLRRDIDAALAALWRLATREFAPPPPPMPSVELGNPDL